MKLKKFFLSSALILTALVCVTILPYSAFALSSSKNKFFGQNNIIFYNPCDDGETVQTVEEATSNSTTVEGSTMLDKFYYGFRSTFSGHTMVADTFTALVLYLDAGDSQMSVSSASAVGRASRSHLLEGYLYSVLPASARSLSLDVIDFREQYSSDSAFLRSKGDEANSLIAGYIMDLKNYLGSSPSLYSGTSALDIANMFYHGAHGAGIPDDFDYYYQYITSYTPDPGSGSTGVARTTETPTTQTPTQSTSCTSSVISTLTEGEQTTDPTGGGEETPTGGGETPITPASGAMTTLNWGGKSWKVVNTSIAVQTYASGAASRGLRQSARDWPYSEVRNGKHGWNNQCVNLAYTHTCNLRNGTYSSTNTNTIPQIGCSLSTYTNTDSHATLVALYNQLAQGKPVVLMTGLHRNSANRSRDTRHFITIVGVRASADPSNLSFTDLLAIDAWNANLMDMSSSSARKVLPGSALGQSNPGYRFNY